jgi:hypothetical protein
MKLVSSLVLATACHFASSAVAAIVISTPGASVLNTFDTLPAATEFSTLAALDSGIGQAGVTTAAGLDAAINANTNVSAANLTSPLISTATWAPTQNSSGRYNTGANTGAGTTGFLQTRATGSAYVVIMATLLNSTGSNIISLDIAYNYFTGITMTADEDIDGLRAYYSLSGASGTWVNITALSSDSTVTTGSISAPEALTTTLDLSATPWTNGSNFYILWADDNGPPVADAQGAANERSYHIDNLSFTAQVPEPTTHLAALALLGLCLQRRHRSVR